LTNIPENPKVKEEFLIEKNSNALCPLDIMAARQQQTRDSGCCLAGYPGIIDAYSTGIQAAVHMAVSIPQKRGMISHITGL
jgi:hypothetical protein